MTIQEKISVLKKLQDKFKGDESANEILDEALYYLTDRPEDFDGYDIDDLLEEARGACVNALDSALEELREEIS